MGDSAFVSSMFVSYHPHPTLLQDAVTAGLVTVPHVKSELNLADALTKLLPNAPKFRWAASRLHSWTMAL